MLYPTGAASKRSTHGTFRDDARGREAVTNSEETRPINATGTAERSNGLSPVAPNPDQLILVAGGAGYIGCILIPRLLERGYRVRLLDRLYFGEEALADFRERIELVVADVRDVPAEALEDVDGVINLSGLSNDPTAEFNPGANW